MLHLGIAGFTQGGSKKISTIVPFSINSLWLSRYGLSAPDKESVTALSVPTTELTGGEIQYSASALDSIGNHLRVRIDGLKMIAVGNPQPERSEEERKIFCHHIICKPDISVFGSGLFEYLDSVPLDSPEPVQFWDDMEFAFLVFISRALEDIDDDSMIPIQPHLHKYIDWARVTLSLCEAGRLPGDRSHWRHLFKDSDHVDDVLDRLKE